jgi:pyruvate formate lyase activating enzyme
MTGPENTGPQTLLRAAEIGRQEGLRYVYCGNLPGMAGENENTFCHQCGALLVGRYGYTILEYRVTRQGTCPECGTKIPGVWWAE